MLIKAKPFLIGLITLMLLSTLGVSLGFYQQQKQKAISEVSSQLTLALELRHTAIDRFFHTIQSEILFWSKNESLNKNTRTLIAGWRELGSNAANKLRDDYIENNPHPVGEKQQLNSAQNNTKYNLIHEQVQQKIGKFIKTRHYDDVLIIDAKANVIYSYMKEHDYASNLNTGPWRDSALGKAFRAVTNKEDPQDIAIVDFESYVPSQGDPASFIAAPIKNKQGVLFAVIVFQIPIEHITKVMQHNGGMGKTGETYLVGDDFLMRSNSRFSKLSTILRISVETETAKKALKGESGIQFTKDYRGIPVLSAYATLNLMGLKWAILSEQDRAEILQPIDALRDRLIIASISIALIMIFSSIWLTSYSRRV